MLLVQWQPDAEHDLLEIVSYIAQRNPDAAQRVKDAIEQAASQVPHHPYLYRVGIAAGTREMVVHPNYVVIYCLTLTAVQIINVIHSRQQYP